MGVRVLYVMAGVDHTGAAQHVMHWFVNTEPASDALSTMLCTVLSTQSQRLMFLLATQSQRAMQLMMAQVSGDLNMHSLAGQRGQGHAAGQGAAADVRLLMQ